MVNRRIPQLQSFFVRLLMIDWFVIVDQPLIFLLFRKKD
jgi:hypothetical protein